MKKFNVIDILIVAVLIAAVAAVGFLKASGGNDEVGTKLITLEIAEKYEGFSENVVIGDSVTEKVNKVRIGKVVGVETKPCEKNTFNAVTGEAVTAIVPGRENVYVTLEVSENADIAAGKQLSIITKHFQGAGYVVEM